MKKRLIAIALCVLLLGLTPVPALAATAWTDGVSYDAGSTFDGGTGLETDPFIISSATALAQLAVNVNDATAPLTYSGAYFRLDANLDLSGSYWVPIGSFDTYKFSGTFDGNGHTISNCTVYDTAAQGAGLFGYMTSAYIYDLGVIDCDVTGWGGVGGLAGFADAGTSIHNCYTTGTVTAVPVENYEGEAYNGIMVGGLVGNYGNALTTIDGCWSSADVDGDRFIGGLVGYMSAGHIKNSYATGTVGSLTSGAYDAGGLVGCSDQSLIEGCYATGDVIATGSVGGFIGDTYSNGDNNVIKNCYARGDVTSTYEWGYAAGGFIGAICDTDIYNCYSSGNVSYTAASEAYWIGGFMGSTDSPGEKDISFTNCFFDSEVTGREAAGNSDDATSAAYTGITGLTTANMQGYDTLTSATKMDTLDSGEGAPVSDVPIWYAHSLDYPDFEVEYCTVTYDSQGADTAASPASATVLLGETVGTLPSDPVKSDRIFGGWYTETDGGGTEFTASTAVSGTMTVYAKWTELTLDSSVAGGTIYVGGRITLTPNVDDGEWDWDEEYLSATFNSPATFTGLKVGTTTVTYTVQGISKTYDVTIEESNLPSTGQDYTWVWMLLITAGILITAGMFSRRKKRRKA